VQKIQKLQRTNFKSKPISIDYLYTNPSSQRSIKRGSRYIDFESDIHRPKRRRFVHEHVDEVISNCL